MLRLYERSCFSEVICPAFKACKSIFLLEELFKLFYSRLVEVFIWGKKSYSQGRTSELWLWSHILTPKSWFCTHSYLSSIIPTPTHILKRDLILHLLAANSTGTSFSAVSACSGSEILTSRFLAFWKTHFCFCFLYASLWLRGEAPSPPLDICPCYCFRLHNQMSLQSVVFHLCLLTCFPFLP